MTADALSLRTSFAQQRGGLYHRNEPVCILTILLVFPRTWQLSELNTKAVEADTVLEPITVKKELEIPTRLSVIVSRLMETLNGAPPCTGLRYMQLQFTRLVTHVRSLVRTLIHATVPLSLTQSDFQQARSKVFEQKRQLTSTSICPLAKG